MSEPVLFRWPPAAALGRTVPKAKFYEHGRLPAALREKFVDDVQRVTWGYKLADDTIRLQGTSAVPEIQVFTIEAKGADVSTDVLRAIDKSVHFPIIFEVASADRVRTVAAKKSLIGKGPTIGAYFTTAWQRSTASRRPLPAAVDLPSLYDAILATLLPAQMRVGESVSEAAARLTLARQLQRGIATLEKKLRAEPQLNRKLELRRQIRKSAAALGELTDPVPSNEE